MVYLLGVRNKKQNKEMTTATITETLQEELSYLELRHNRKARRYQECVAEGNFIAAQQFAVDACKHELHLSFINAASNPANHDDLRKSNMYKLLNERDPIYLAAAREQYEVVKRFD